MPKASPRKKPSARNGTHSSSGNEYKRLLTLAKENPWRLFHVNEIRTLYNIGEKAMQRYRKLAALDDASDPWDNDKTRPEKFADWYWAKRKGLEEKAIKENKRV